MKRILSLTLVLILILTALAGCGLLGGGESGITCNVNFYVGDTLYMTKKVNMGSTVSMPEAPEKANEIFLGWYTDGLFTSEYDFSRPVIYDTNLYALYTIDAVALTNRITQEIMRSVVTVKTKCYNTGPFGTETTSYTSQGSGVIIDISGGWAYVLTNWHVVEHEEGYKYREITVEDLYGKSHSADIYKNKSIDVAAISEEYDLALLCFRYSEGDLIEIGISSDPNIGDHVVSIGTPGGQKNSITYGKALRYSKINAEDDTTKVNFDIIVHDAPIDHGSSGGPLLNTDCQLVGINFAGYGGGEYGCAIPMSKINEFLNKFVYNK